MKKVLANILPRLINRFSLRATGTVEDLLMEETIQPVTNVDDVLVQYKAEIFTVGVSGSGQKLLCAVPKGKRWTITSAILQLDSGVFTFDSFFIHKINSSINVIIHQTSPSGTLIVLPPGSLPVLDELDSLYSYIVGYTSSGQVRLDLTWKEEDAF